MNAIPGYTTCYYCGWTHLEVQDYRETPKSNMDDGSWKGLTLFLFLSAVVLVAFLVIAFNMFAPSMTFGPNTANMKGGGDGSGPLQYDWNYWGMNYWMRLNITEQEYQSYVSMDVLRSQSHKLPEEQVMSYVTAKDPTIENVTIILNKLAVDEGLDRFYTAGLALSFVQYIEYQSDYETNGRVEYWSFPVETLYLHAGDCEDKSFLLASIFEKMGYDAVILIDTEHVMVGLACEGAHGDSIEFQGIEYLYCETTAVGWEIGQLPDVDFSPTVVQVE
jgi:hypothetical protein